MKGDVEIIQASRSVRLEKGSRGGPHDDGGGGHMVDEFIRKSGGIVTLIERLKFFDVAVRVRNGNGPITRGIRVLCAFNLEGRGANGGSERLNGVRRSCISKG